MPGFTTVPFMEDSAMNWVWAWNENETKSKHQHNDCTPAVFMHNMTQHCKSSQHHHVLHVKCRLNTDGDGMVWYTRV